MEPTPTRIAPVKRFFVEITERRGSITYFFNERYGDNGAESFFLNACKQEGINPTPLYPQQTYRRERKPGLIIDFEQIKDLALTSIFDMN